MKKFFRCLERRKGDKSVKTQKQAQDLYEQPEFLISTHYASIMKTMFFTAMYAPVIPLGVLISLVGLFVVYWGYKYNLLNRNMVKYSMSAELSIEMTEILE